MNGRHGAGHLGALRLYRLHDTADSDPGLASYLRIEERERVGRN